MGATELALLGFIFLYLLLYGAIVFWRAGLTLTAGRKANSFDPDGKDVSELAARLSRAHANCFEAFPFFGGLLLFAMLMDLTDITNGLALVVLAARIGQSVVHVISTSVMAVQLRFTFFLIQYFIAFYWLISFLKLA